MVVQNHPPPWTGSGGLLRKCRWLAHFQARSDCSAGNYVCVSSVGTPPKVWLRRAACLLDDHRLQRSPAGKLGRGDGRVATAGQAMLHGPQPATGLAG